MIDIVPPYNPEMYRDLRITLQKQEACEFNRTLKWLCLRPDETDVLIEITKLYRKSFDYHQAMEKKIQKVSVVFFGGELLLKMTIADDKCERTIFQAAPVSSEESQRWQEDIILKSNNVLRNWVLVSPCFSVENRNCVIAPKVIFSELLEPLDSGWLSPFGNHISCPERLLTLASSEDDNAYLIDKRKKIYYYDHEEECVYPSILNMSSFLKLFFKNPLSLFEPYENKWLREEYFCPLPQDDDIGYISRYDHLKKILSPLEIFALTLRLFQSIFMLREKKIKVYYSKNLASFIDQYIEFIIAPSLSHSFEILSAQKSRRLKEKAHGLHLPELLPAIRILEDMPDHIKNYGSIDSAYSCFQSVKMRLGPFIDRTQTVLEMDIKWLQEHQATIISDKLLDFFECPIE